MLTHQLFPFPDSVFEADESNQGGQDWRKGLTQIDSGKALCSIAPEIGITKGHGQNIVRGLTFLMVSCQLVKRVQKPKAAIFCPGLPVLQIDSPKMFRTMFLGIRLYGAEINAEFSEQHRAHRAFLP